MQALAQQVDDAGVRRVTGDVVGDATRVRRRTHSRRLADALPRRRLRRASERALAQRECRVGRDRARQFRTRERHARARDDQHSAREQRAHGGRWWRAVFVWRSARRNDHGIAAPSVAARESGATRYVVDDPATVRDRRPARGAHLEGNPVGGATRLGATPSGAVKIAALASPQLARMISAMNRESINHFAELLFRDGARGPKRNVQGSGANGNHAMHEFLAHIGADSSRISQRRRQRSLASRTGSPLARWSSCSATRTTRRGDRSSTRRCPSRARAALSAGA